MAGDAPELSVTTLLELSVDLKEIGVQVGALHPLAHDEEHLPYRRLHLDLPLHVLLGLRLPIRLYLHAQQRRLVSIRPGIELDLLTTSQPAQLIEIWLGAQPTDWIRIPGFPAISN